MPVCNFLSQVMQFARGGPNNARLSCPATQITGPALKLLLSSCCIALCMTLSAGCSTAGVAPSSEVTVSKPAARLPGLRYAWVPMPAQLPAESDARVLDPQFRKRLQTALDSALQSKGYEAAGTPAQADFLVAFRVGAQDEAQTLLRDEGVGSQPTPQGTILCTDDGCSQMVVPGGDGAPVIDIRRTRYVEGGLQIEVIEPTTLRVVWRALNCGTVQRNDGSTQRLQAIANDTLAQLPRAAR